MLKDNNILVIMTALVPTLGHKYLIDFAQAYNTVLSNTNKSDGNVTVIVFSLPQEPIPGEWRVNSLIENFKGNPFINFYLHKSWVPQEPRNEDDKEFWIIWRDILKQYEKGTPFTHVVASEEYGENLASVLGAEFIPCNIYREVVPVKGSDVRMDIIKNFPSILPEFQHHVTTKVTMFGAESTGKTTLSKSLAKKMNGHFVPEWAREYLETVGADLSIEKMENIAHAQYAAQNAAKYTLFNKPFIFQDTDLLCTYGYYKICNYPIPDWLTRAVVETKSDFYILTDDTIPFEPDPLRYGIDKRESDNEFWENLLKEFNCEYFVLPKGMNKHQQVIYSELVVMDIFFKKEFPIVSYVR